MRTPLVSVVIPFYRAENLLGITIDSVLAQTFKDYEIVLVDNNANAKSKEVAENQVIKYPEIIRILHEKTQGACSARNRGILESKGKYIALLDEDDVMLPQRLEKQVSYIEKNNEVALVTSYFNRISHDGREILSKNVKNFFYSSIETEINLIKDILTVVNGYGYKSLAHEEKKKNIDSFHLTFPSTYFFSKDLAIKAGMFDPCFNPCFFEDVEFQTRMFAWGDFFQIPESLVLYRATSSDYEKKRSTVRSESIFLNHHKYIEILCRQYWNQGKKVQTAIRRLRSHYLKNIGISLFSYPDGSHLGKKFLTLALEENPYSLDAWKFYFKSYFPRSLHPRLFWFSEFNPNTMGEFGFALQKTFCSLTSIQSEDKKMAP